MIVSMILAMSLQSAETVEAECHLTAQGLSRRNSIPTSLRVDCPDDVVDADSLQQIADYSVGQIPLDLDRGSRLEISETVRFGWGLDDSWVPIAGQRVINVIATNSRTRLVERGYRSQTCSYGIWPDTHGRPANSEIVCTTGIYERPGSRRTARLRMLTAIGNMRFLPAEERYCFQEESFVEIAVWRDRSRGPDTPPPLPMICDRQILKNDDFVQAGLAQVEE